MTVINLKDITGRRYGRLVAIKPTDEMQDNTRVWLCHCDCGKECLTSLNRLTQGLVRSCGCLVQEARAKKVAAMTEAGDRKYKIDGTDLRRISIIPDPRSKTGVRGVCPDRGKYRAYISFQGKRYYLGRHDTIEEAQKARKEAQAQLWGEFFKKHPHLKEPE